MCAFAIADYCWSSWRSRIAAPYDTNLALIDWLIDLVTRGHFWSRNKNGGHGIRSAIDKTLCCTQTSWVDLCFIEPKLLPIEVFHRGNRDFRLFCSCDFDLHITWAKMNFLRQGFRKLYYRHTDIRTYIHKRNCLRRPLRATVKYMARQDVADRLVTGQGSDQLTHISCARMMVHGPILALWIVHSLMLQAWFAQMFVVKTYGKFSVGYRAMNVGRLFSGSHI